jgi:hypothetical protein
MFYLGLTIYVSTPGSIFKWVLAIRFQAKMNALPYNLPLWVKKKESEAQLIVTFKCTDSTFVSAAFAIVTEDGCRSTWSCCSWACSTVKG